MHINTTARHCELGHEDRTFAHERMEKFQRFAHDIHETHLVVTAESYRFVAEITLRLKHREIACREESTEARRAIDLAADRIEEQLRRVHERRISRRRAARAVNGRAEAASPTAEAGESELEDFGDVGEA